MPDDFGGSGWTTLGVNEHVDNAVRPRGANDARSEHKEPGYAKYLELRTEAAEVDA
ncbi:MAG: hypothetical protein AAFQ44_09620 [Pseudomonadota bacterium]